MSSSSLSLAAVATLVLLLVLSPLPFSMGADLVDEDGKPIKNGAHYYIIERHNQQGLTFIQKMNECPLYITLTPEFEGLGTPVQIYDPQNSSPTFYLQISFFSLAFKGSNNSPCKNSSMVWQLELEKEQPYIRTGGDILEVARRHFRIVKEMTPEYEHTYQIEYCNVVESRCRRLGLTQDGLLSLNQEAQVYFSFRKAMVLELPSSSTS